MTELSLNDAEPVIIKVREYIPEAPKPVMTPEERKAKIKARYAENREKILAYQKAYDAKRWWMRKKACKRQLYALGCGL